MEDRDQKREQDEITAADLESQAPGADPITDESPVPEDHGSSVSGEAVVPVTPMTSPPASLLNVVVKGSAPGSSPRADRPFPHTRFKDFSEPAASVSADAQVQSGNGETGRWFLPNPVVCLHGWGQSHRAFAPLADLLGHYTKFHLVDLPGFGLSDPPPQDWDTEQYALRMASYLDEAGLTRIDLIAHSFGGRVALRLARKFPDRVRRVVLIGSHGLRARRTMQGRIRVWTIPRAGKALKKVDALFGTRLFEEKFTPRFGSRDYKAAGKLRGTLVKTVVEDQEPELAEIRQNFLLIWGELDTETPVEMARRFNASLTSSRLIVLKGRGHDCFTDIDAHLCAYYIRHFLHESEPALRGEVGNSR